MCYESRMHWSKEEQLALLKERKKIMKERLSSIEKIIESLEKEKVPSQ